MGYPEGEIVECLRDHYNCKDPEGTAYAAIAFERQRALDVDNAIAKNERAIAAEHSLGISMHKGGNA